MMIACSLSPLPASLSQRGGARIRLRTLPQGVPITIVPVKEMTPDLENIAKPRDADSASFWLFRDYDGMGRFVVMDVPNVLLKLLATAGCTRLEIKAAGGLSWLGCLVVLL